MADPDLPAQEAPLLGPTPCFLVGAPRSGTTWLQRLLQAHPAVCGGEESHFFTFYAHSMIESDRMVQREKRRIGPLTYMSRDRFDAALRHLWDEIFHDLHAAHPQALVHLEKTPFHALCLDQVVRLFPQARILYLARDSRAVAASLMHAGKGWGSHWAPSTCTGAAREWQRHANAVIRFHEAHPEHPFLMLRYEDALEDTRAALERALRFVLPEGTDLQLDETLARYEQEQAARTDPEGFARKRGKAGWQKDLSLWQKLVVWKQTRRKMQELGYDITPFR